MLVSPAWRARVKSPGRVPSRPGIRASASTTRCGSSISPLMSPPCFFLYLQPRRGGVVERPLDTARAVALAEGLDPDRALRDQFHRHIAVAHRLADLGADAAARNQPAARELGRTACRPKGRQYG